MLAAGAPKEHLSARQPLVRLISELARITAIKFIFGKSASRCAWKKSQPTRFLTRQLVNSEKDNSPGKAVEYSVETGLKSRFGTDLIVALKSVSFRMQRSSRLMFDEDHDHRCERHRWHEQALGGTNGANQAACSAVRERFFNKPHSSATGRLRTFWRTASASNPS
jgi:hypothetical protein